MLPVKAVREAVITTLIEWHDKFVSIIYVNEESPVSTFHITPSYIPSGFSQIESSGESTGHYYGQFQNSAGDWFSLRVFPVENTQTISWDNEFSSYYSISFDSNQAIWGIMDDGSNTLLWESNFLAFQVRGNLNITELIKISEGMRNLFADPTAPTVDCGVAQVDTVANLCQLVAGLGRALDGYAHLIQPGFATEATRSGR